jgi:hypothetical protein
MSRENKASNTVLSLNPFGADAVNDTACITNIKTSKRGIEEITAEAKKEIQRFKKDLENKETKMMYIDMVAGKLRSHIRSTSEKAVSDTQNIKGRATWDMEGLAFQKAHDAVQKMNSTERVVYEETVLQQMDTIKAKALQDIEAISAQLDKDAEAITETFETLTAALN